MKKNHSWISAIMASLAILVIMSCCCSGGGNNGSGVSDDTMTVTVVSQAGTATTTYTHNGTDVMTWGGVYTSPAPGITVATMDSPTVQVSVSANGTTPGTYPITGDLSVLMVRYVLYTSPTTTEIYSTDGSGTIEITGIGAVGQQITGTFNAEVFKTFPVSSATNTLTVSGTFSIKRWL